jgi:hypothetical protein
MFPSQKSKTRVRPPRVWKSTPYHPFCKLAGDAPELPPRWIRFEKPSRSSRERVWDQFSPPIEYGHPRRSSYPIRNVNNEHICDAIRLTTRPFNARIHPRFSFSDGIFVGKHFIVRSKGSRFRHGLDVYSSGFRFLLKFKRSGV